MYFACIKHSWVPYLVPIPGHQPSIVPIPDHQPSIAPIPDHQPSTVLIPDHQPSTAPIPDHQPSIISIPDHQPSTVLIPDHQPSTVPIPGHQPHHTGFHSKTSCSSPQGGVCAASVGVITPYRHQQNMIRKLFRNNSDTTVLKLVHSVTLTDGVAVLQCMPLDYQ